jgi:hypothetical protein
MMRIRILGSGGAGLTVLLKSHLVIGSRMN